MTKYVLNSGGIGDYPDRAKAYFSELVKSLGDTPKVLICSFAQPRELWEEIFARDTKSTGWYPDGVEPVFDMAFPEKFVQQLNECDAVYIDGGDDHLMQYWLKQFDLPSIWEGKVVGTNSASSNALAESFWTCDWRKIMDGLGILPIKFIAHYESDFGADDPRGPIDWSMAHKELAAYGDTSLPIHALQEGEYVVIEQ